MITLEKLRIFVSYRGDGDMFSRSARQKEKQIMNYDEWVLIDTLIQDAAVLNRQLGSEERNAQAAKRLTENSEDEKVVGEIKRLAEIDFRRR